MRNNSTIDVIIHNLPVEVTIFLIIKHLLESNKCRNRIKARQWSLARHVGV